MVLLKKNIIDTDAYKHLSKFIRKCSEHLSVMLPKLLKQESEEERKALVEGLSLFDTFVSISFFVICDGLLYQPWTFYLLTSDDQ